MSYLSALFHAVIKKIIQHTNSDKLSERDITWFKERLIYKLTLYIGGILIGYIMYLFIVVDLKYGVFFLELVFLISVPVAIHELIQIKKDKRK